MKTETRVLVADDEPDMLRGLERALLYEGDEVEPAGDGLEAGAKLKAQHFDVVVADLKMPVVGGMDLLRTAKQRDHSIVFIMITGYATVENAVEAMRLGSSDYIAKPFTPSDLIAAIEKGLYERWQKRSAKSPAARQTSRIYSSPGEHAWVSPQPDGTVVIGADGKFFEEAGDIVFCDLPLEGAEILKGQRCARTIDSTGLTQKPFHCPLSGTVVELNDKMIHDPWGTRKDPYGEAWLFRIAPSKLEEEIKTLAPRKETAVNNV